MKTNIEINFINKDSLSFIVSNNELTAIKYSIKNDRVFDIQNKTINMENVMFISYDEVK